MIRKATKRDVTELAGLAVLLWDSHTVQQLADEFAAILQKGDASFFLQYEQGEAVGFAQCQLRHDYVESTHSSPVGYLEGIFVKEQHRHKGYASALLQASESWALQMGCSEFASDCPLSNTESQAFHMGVGFTEANKLVCFVKKIQAEKKK